MRSSSITAATTSALRVVYHKHVAKIARTRTSSACCGLYAQKLLRLQR
jgi:hypothetical protein